MQVKREIYVGKSHYNILRVHVIVVSLQIILHDLLFVFQL